MIFFFVELMLFGTVAITLALTVRVFKNAEQEAFVPQEAN